MTKNSAMDDLERIESGTDWSRLVEMAMATPPSPMELRSRLNRWAIVFRVAYGGEPLEPDYPDAVREFLRQLAMASRIGRPCSDEKHIFAVLQAWRNAVFRDGYEKSRTMAELAKEAGIPYNGRLLLGDTPSEAAINDIVENSKDIEFGVDRLRKIIFPTRKK